jgi:hypothetical protein
MLKDRKRPYLRHSPRSGIGLKSTSLVILAALHGFLLAMSLVCVGCAGQTVGTLRVSEGIGKSYENGTLILAEVGVGLTRWQTLERFGPEDLHAAGLSESDVKSGMAVMAVFVTPWAQTQRGLTPELAFSTVKGLYALVNKSVADSLATINTCDRGICKNGGDAVAVRVLRKPSDSTGITGLYVVDSIVEPANVHGDCFYVTRGWRKALYCKSLDNSGWEWDDNVFVKRPGIAFRN